MSTLEVSNLNDGTTTVATTYVTNGSAKAWVNLNGTGTILTYDSLNVSSISDSGTGTYVVNINSDMSNTNYGITTGGSDSLTGFIGRIASPVNTKTSGAYGIETINNAGSSFTDYVNVMTQVNGDLA